MAVLDFASGGDVLDAVTSLPLVSVEHVNTARRLVDISVAIREMWRQSLEDPTGVIGADADSDDPDSHVARPVRGNYSQDGFAAALSTQLPPAGIDGVLVTPPSLEHPEAPAAPDIWRSQPGFRASLEEPTANATPGEEVVPVLFGDVPAQDVFDNQGLGIDGAMLFSKTGTAQLFKDRCLMRRLLLSGKSSTTVAKLVDSFGHDTHESNAKKRKKVRPAKKEVETVLQAAFAQFPRLGVYIPGGRDQQVTLKGWTQSDEGQVLFHNKLMRCCRVSLQEVSKKRAAFYEARPAARNLVDESIAPALEHDPGAASRQDGPAGDDEMAAIGLVPAPATPPGGVVF